MQQLARAAGNVSDHKPVTSGQGTQTVTDAAAIRLHVHMHEMAISGCISEKAASTLAIHHFGHIIPGARASSSGVVC